MTRILFFARSSKYTLGLPQGFRELNCPVFVLRDLSRDSIKEAVDHFRPDLFITTGWAYRRHKRKYIDQLVEKVAKHRIKHVYWATEDPRWTEECSFECIKIFNPDAILTIHPESVSIYQRLGFPAGHLDFGCNPEFNKYEPPSSKYAYDVALVGNGGKEWKSYRKDSVQTLLRPLVERGHNIAIWGKRWDRFNEDLMGFKIPKHILKGELPYEETNKVYNSAKIIIGLQNDQDMLTSRTFEVLGSGGFLLTMPTRAVKNLFINNAHLVCSSSPEDTVNLVDYYLKDGKARQEVAQNGQREVCINHTYKERAKQILKFL
ncbi:spore maturation protein CgeB [Anaerosolibacter carboniphilus]|uniref:Spore maturation protein CgeB n=1 Tax=Anaerosolibacter carboniphilus TaxID=1417629 RepID=A0A841KYZ4_9FIRM|nr:glycosyltransferase [Anaerosolibacter carboniphilus]MBB6215359.1 spore maturation protein CgeB [Anaerosolibacter carboniphilus]